MTVASEISPGEVRKNGFPAMLFGDNVVGFESRRGEFFGQAAVLAASSGPATYLVAQGWRDATHALEVRFFKACRAFEWRIPRTQPSFS